MQDNFVAFLTLDLTSMFIGGIDKACQSMVEITMHVSLHGIQMLLTRDLLNHLVDPRYGLKKEIICPEKD